jgi:pyruvate/2-oxoglutarate dehydrogenase complex dihydrolipoamide acyltransferase (E2) component
MDTTEAVIGTWFVKEGEYVHSGVPLLEVESEKVTFVIEAEQSGRLSQILHATGETVPVGEVVGIVEAE